MNIICLNLTIDPSANHTFIPIVMPCEVFSLDMGGDDDLPLVWSVCDMHIFDSEHPICCESATMRLLFCGNADVGTVASALVGAGDFLLAEPVVDCADDGVCDAPGRFIVILITDKFRSWNFQVVVHWRLQSVNHGCYRFSSLQSHFFRGFAAGNAEFVASVFERLATGACAWCATATCFFTLLCRRLLGFHLVLRVHNLLQCTLLILRSDLENTSKQNYLEWRAFFMMFNTIQLQFIAELSFGSTKINFGNALQKI